jgi:hypothetical protein
VSGRYYYQVSTGVLIPITAFLNFTKINDTLSHYFRMPTLNTTVMDHFVASTPQHKAKKLEIQKVRKDNNVKPANAVAYWSRQDVALKYGPYATTYAMMAERYVQANQESRDKTRKRVDKMGPEERDARRLKINAQKAARSRKYKEAKETDAGLLDKTNG